MIALYPGAFKPPHRGHFEVVKRLLNGTHNGHVYSIDNYKDVGTKALIGKEGKADKIDKVIVFPGGGERNGITKGESMAIWKIYAKYLPGIEVRDGEKNPMFAAKDYAKANSQDNFYAITGVRDESDFVDLKRITTFKNRDNVEGLLMTPKKDASVRASDLRTAALHGSLDDIRDFFPKELKREELLSILKMLKDNIISEIMNEKMETLFEAMFASQEESNAEEKTKIQLPEYTEHIASVLEYMLDQGMKITPLPEVKTIKDEANAADFFGRTAYYDPNKQEVVLYVEGRHPKDIVRSFVHEMVHHMQNLEGRLGQIGTSNTNEDDHLLEIEKEAYLKGNITFRNWEDSVKNGSKKKVMAEGKYDSLVSALNKKSIEAIKKALAKKQNVYKENHFETDEQIKVAADESYPIMIVQVPDEIEGLQGDAGIDFDYNLKVLFPKGINKVLSNGGAVAGKWDKDGEDYEEDPFIDIELAIDPYNMPRDLEEVSRILSDILRHEIEHLTQAGVNAKGKDYKDGQFGGKFGTTAEKRFRKKIEDGDIEPKKYLLLPSEIDANLQGLYSRAKKERRPFADIVDQYLYQFTEMPRKGSDGEPTDQPVLTKQEVEDIKKQWALRLPTLGIKQRL